MKGGCGRWVRGVDATDVTVTSAPVSARAIDAADASPKTWTFALASRTPPASKFLPVASGEPSTDSSVASKALPRESSVAVTSNHVAEVKSIRSRSRSQTRRIATDWTRPADRALSTARQSTGETS